MGQKKESSCQLCESSWIVISDNLYWDKAIEILQKANGIGAADERGFYLLALALEGKREKGKAIESLQKANKIEIGKVVRMKPASEIYSFRKGEYRIAK